MKKMKVLMFSIIIFLLGGSVGLTYGYVVALNNQVYFDAPAKISLYSSLIEHNRSDEYLKSQITSQAHILMEEPRHTNRFLLNMPIHGGMKEAYELHASKLADNNHYLKAIDMICIYNEEFAFSHEEVCNKIN